MTNATFTPCTPAEAELKKAKALHKRPQLIGVEAHAKAIKAAIKRNRPSLLIGGAATGKSSLAEECAYDMKRPYITINLHGHVTPDQLVGRMMAKASNGTTTYFQYGTLAKAMQQGQLVILNEINAAMGETLFILHSILEKNPYLYVPETEERIEPAAGFCVIATMNPEQDYAGTRELNAALYSRFDVVRRFDELVGSDLITALKQHVPTAKDEHIMAAMTALQDIRNARKEDRIRTLITLRDAISALELMNDLDQTEALLSAMYSKLKVEERTEVPLSVPETLPAGLSLSDMLDRCASYESVRKELTKATSELMALGKLREVMAAFTTAQAAS
jgi:MoxR-like ATPase